VLISGIGRQVCATDFLVHLFNWDNGVSGVLYLGLDGGFCRSSVSIILCSVEYILGQMQHRTAKKLPNASTHVTYYDSRATVCWIGH